jgi:uncharacterized protein (TIGR00251 family)
MVTAVEGGVMLDVRVIPRAGRSGLDGTRNGALLVRLSAPPVDGAANAELIALLATLLDLPRRSLTIAAGQTGRMKRVRIAGASPDFVHARIASGLPD